MQVACEVTSRCVEMMGGVGFIRDMPVEKFYRDSKIGRSQHCSSGAHDYQSTLPPLSFPNCYTLPPPLPSP